MWCGLYLAFERATSHRAVFLVFYPPQMENAPDSFSRLAEFTLFSKNMQQ
jgi:hypothetical protein